MFLLEGTAPAADSLGAILGVALVAIAAGVLKWVDQRSEPKAAQAPRQGAAGGCSCTTTLAEVKELRRDAEEIVEKLDGAREAATDAAHRLVQVVAHLERAADQHSQIIAQAQNTHRRAGEVHELVGQQNNLLSAINRDNAVILDRLAKR